MAKNSRVVVYMGCSLDGFIAGPDNDLSWLSQDHGREGDLAADPGYVSFEDFMGRTGAMLMGRTTYDTVAGMGVWPYADTPVIVATTRALESDQKTVTASRGDITALVDEAKTAAGDKDVYLDGGALVRQALDAGLVDEMIITFVPIAVGAGIRLFDGLREHQRFQFSARAASGGGLLQVSARVVPAKT